ncbi:type 1 fimbrial protein [Salmonella enterica]|nr:type 1 fimbrial protein [Salmonella enterica]
MITVPPAVTPLESERDRRRGTRSVNDMNRAEQMMKRAENTGAGNHLIRKTIPGQYKRENQSAGRITTVLSRRGMVTGLALLLSAGMCGGAAGQDFVLFTYTVVVNSCTLTSTGATTNTDIGASSSFNVNWGAVTSGQLLPGHEDPKTFGVEMNCAGLPYAPKLTITGTNSTKKDSTIYVSDSPGSAAGFAVRAATSGDGATETDKTTAALTGTATLLAENTEKKILLTAWPSLMPDKKPADLKGVRDIKGAVTITVSYN